MTRWLGRFSPYCYALLRIVAGMMFAVHGAMKVFGWPGTKGAMPIASLPGAAGIIELVCGVLIMIGLLASFAAFLASGEMAYAYFTVHAFPPGGPHIFWPPLNGGELAVLYCFLFLYIATRGSGVWSVDALMGRANT
jgi:putative oxidoreductase